MEQAKLGIDALKLAVKFGCDFGEAMEVSLADGKLGIEDAGAFLTVFMQDASGFAKYGLIPAQLKDMDAVEAAELVQYAKDELKLAHEGIEMKIEKCLEAAVVMLQLAEMFKKKA